MSEKFNLKWNDFQSNVSRTFSLLRNEKEFFDVSLVSEDQKMISAHKLVLSACSPYFKHVLTENKHSHPLLCLDGVSSGELHCVLDYIYQGEVQVYQEQLDRFLEVAQKFQLEGLNCTDTKEEQLPEYENSFEEPEPEVQNNFRTKETYKAEVERQRTRKPLEETSIVSIENYVALAELEEKIAAYIVKNNDRTYSCGKCGKNSGKYLTHIKNHIETHMEGLSFPCQSCDKTFRSRNSLSNHTSKYHRF